MNRHSKLWLTFALVGLVSAIAFAQFRGGGGGGGRGGGRGRQPPDPNERGNVPQWQLEPAFERDCFTFARVKYTTAGAERSSRAWWTDFPDADLNLSWRLHHHTALKVHPNGKVIELTDPELVKYPLVFMSGVPGIDLSEEDIRRLRNYLDNGGFLMVDDFWGEANWNHFYREVIKRMFPNREPFEIPLEHPIFHMLFDMKEKPQIPNVYFATRNQGTGVTWEVADGQTPHYRGLKDDQGRLIAVFCHNTDLGDGWEEEHTDPYYFATFSEPKAYPLGLNIIFYVMTH
jgi:hypothetical protein